MKITFLIQKLSERGGTHKQLLRLCQLCKAKNIDFNIITRAYEKELGYIEFMEFEGQIEILKKSKIPILNEIFSQFRLARNTGNSTDIINVHDNGFHFFLLFISLLNLGHKTIWQINDLPGSFQVGNLKASKQKPRHFFSRKIFKFIAKRINSITVNVSKNQKRVRELLKKDSHLFHCGIDSPFILQELNIKPLSNPIQLLSVGVFFPYRNYETLLELGRQLKIQGIEFKINIIGSMSPSPSYANKIKEIISKYELSSEVNLLGSISEKSFDQITKQSDFFLFLNIDQSWGLSVFESMSLGIPVIVSKSVGACELLQNDFDSTIVNPTDVIEIKSKLITLIEDEDKRNQLIRNAKETTNVMSWDIMYGEKMIKLFESIRDEYV